MRTIIIFVLLVTSFGVYSQQWSSIDFEFYNLEPTNILKLPDGNMGVMSEQDKFDARAGELDYITNIFYVVSPEGQVLYKNILNSPAGLFVGFTIFDEENVFVPYTKWQSPLVTYCSEDSISIGETHRRGMNRQFFLLDMVVNVFDSIYNVNGYCEEPYHLGGAIHENDLVFVTEEYWSQDVSDQTYSFQRHDLNGNELSSFEYTSSENRIKKKQQGIFLDGKMLFSTNLRTVDSTLAPIDYPRYPGVVEYDLNTDNVAIINTELLGNNFSSICDFAEYAYDPSSFIVPFIKYDPLGDEYSIGRMDKDYNLLWRKIIPAPVKIIGLSNGNIVVLSPARETFTIFLFDENGALLAERKYDNPLNALEYKPVSFTVLNDEKTFVVAGQQGRDTTIARGFGNVDRRVGLMTHSLDSLNQVSSTVDRDFKTKINLFPNPISNSFSVEIPESEKSFSLQIFSTLGQKVFDEKSISSKDKIDTSELSNGVFFYEIVTENRIRKSGKIVIAN